MAAAYKVLGTVELLEMILSHLPPRDLYQATTTCHQFHAVCNSSPSLQKALFLSPDSSKLSRGRRWNPIIFVACSNDDRLRFGPHSMDSEPMSFRINLIDFIKGRISAHHGYKQMFLTQPPCQEARGMSQVNLEGHGVPFRLFKEAGVTLGDVLCELRAHPWDSASTRNNREIGSSWTIYIQISVMATAEERVAVRELWESRMRPRRARIAALMANA
ncbi:hypothetical protein LTR37_001587 [Vermiconidia calcicola]|uniref:Uncharacterized protein n=1 Tax=Vermiconidia calcicola TaxID=1690605 RepID=A0ACC3NVM4_9PEZI|nr:hypothetical protein LTR37_001587 [Vermiconidia calcicola]